MNPWLDPWLSALGPPDTLVLLACVVAGGALAGELIARTTRLPRVVGYTLAGWAAALGGFGATLPLNPTAGLLIDIALALLLFEIGSRVRLRWLRHNPGLMATSVLESLVAGVAVFFALRWLGQPPAVAGACAVLAIPASASVAGRVAHEIRADGQVTQRMTILTALNTLYGVLALVVLRAWIEAEHAPELGAALIALAASSIGALGVAAVLAWTVSLAARQLDLRQEGAALLVLGLVLLAMAITRWLGLSTLLVPLLAGLLLRNLSDRAWAWPRHFGTAGALFVLLLFAIVGSAWSPQLLALGGIAALALLAARGVAKALVVSLLSPWSKLSLRKGAALSLTLTPLSATALVMLNELVRSDAAIGAAVAPIVLTAVAVAELLGPIAVLVALRAAGEVAAPAEPASKEAS